MEIHEQQVPTGTELHLTVFCCNHPSEGEISIMVGAEWVNTIKLLYFFCADKEFICLEISM